MIYRKKFIPRTNLRKLLKNREHSRIDNTESEPKQEFADGSSFLAELRQLDAAADEALKSHSPTTG
jgi:hypothetical protein